MEYMATLPDKAFDLAIVDPPYGMDFGSFNRTNCLANGTRIKADKYKNADWDKGIPTDEYFAELSRVAKHSIIWGGNYFDLPPTQGFVFWYKQNPVDNFSDGEYAWTSFQRPAKCFNFKYYGNLEGHTSASEKIHPTQKPVKLYEWLLTNYAKPGQRILDTHLGSGSHAIACNNLGFELVGCELDKDYFDSAVKRIKSANSIGRLFTPEQIYKSRKSE
jgi:site-specific DNA-methyltransferase (adenine-specific)